MRAFRLSLLCALPALLLALDAGAQPAVDAFAEKLRADMEAAERTTEERARDDNRSPVETLGFFGLRGHMRVLEVVPGGGGCTKLLAPALREKAELHVWVGFQRCADWVDQPGLEGVWRVADGAQILPTCQMQLRDPEGSHRLDQVWPSGRPWTRASSSTAGANCTTRRGDELRYEVGRRSVTGNTNRFTFRLRKSE